MQDKLIFLPFNPFYNDNDNDNDNDYKFNDL